MPIIRDYLMEIGTSVIKVGCEITMGRKNHVDTKCNLPKTNAFAVMSRVMLLVNYIVEYNVYNRAVGTVVDTVYHPGENPGNSAFPAHVVVDFLHCTIPSEFAYDSSRPTHVPIPVKSVRCEQRCCSMSTIPLRVCKTITTYKSQECQLD